MENKKQYGTRWLKFYIIIRLPLSIVLGIIGFFSSCTQANDTDYPLIYILLLLFDAALLIFRMKVFEDMRSLSLKGYLENEKLLILECLEIPFFEMLLSFMFLTGYDLVVNISACVGVALFWLLIWYLPNHLYFKRRRFLFNGEWSLKCLPKKVSQESASAPALDFAEQQQFSGDYVYYVDSAKSHVENTFPKEAQPLIVCRICGSIIQESNAKFCGNCGHRLSREQIPSRQSYLVCKNCNMKIPDIDAKFCPNCGVSLKKNSNYVVEA